MSQIINKLHGYKYIPLKNGEFVKLFFAEDDFIILEKDYTITLGGWFWKKKYKWNGKDFIKC